MVKGPRKLRTRHRKPVRNPSPQRSDSSLPADHCSDSETEEFPTPAEVERNRRNKTFAWEAQGHFVGPVDPAWFIDYYFKIQEIDKPTFPAGGSPAWTGLQEDISKVDMHQHIIDGARRFLKDHGKEGSGFVQGHSAEDSAPDDGLPSIINYHTPPRSKLDFSNVEYFVEAQTSRSFDPFVDNDDNDSDRYEYYPFEAIADLRMTTRGQILAYCTSIVRSQFRTHVFGVIVLGHCDRLFHWDPSGMVVTSLFDYTNQTDNYLAQFIWYYDNASPLTRGHDTSVEHISETQAYEFVGQEIAERVKARNPHHSHFCTMNIPDRENGEIQHLHLISYPPPCHVSSSFERMTRTVQAFDLETKEFVFVKDYWRDVTAEAEKEGDIYTLLEKHNVPNIAPFGHGNDVQCKVRFKDSEDSVLRPVYTRHKVRPGDKIQKHKRLKQWTLYRMSLKVIGESLKTFKSTKQLVTVIADAMEAHDAAFFDAHILHRDISIGNILIHNGRGLLIDWDSCLIVVNGPRSAPRAGTWLFMSAAILLDPEKVHDICDDRESAFYVLTWTALCYANHNQMDPDHLRKCLGAYDYSYSAGKYMKGGALKTHALFQRILSEEVAFNPPLDRLIADLIDHLRARYVPIDTDNQAYIDSLTKKITDLEQVAERTETQQEMLELLRGFREHNSVYRLSTSLQLLKVRGWLVETLRKHLDSPDWPLNDTARSQAPHRTCNSKKRGRDGDSRAEGRSKIQSLAQCRILVIGDFEKRGRMAPDLCIPWGCKILHGAYK